MATHLAGDTYNLISSGVGTIQTMANGTGSNTQPTFPGIAAASDYTQGAKVIAGADATFACSLATISSAVAGVQTLKWSAISSTTIRTEQIL